MAPCNSSLIIERTRDATYRCFARQTYHPPAPAGSGTEDEERTTGPLVGSVGGEGATGPSGWGGSSPTRRAVEDEGYAYKGGRTEHVPRHGEEGKMRQGNEQCSCLRRVAWREEEGKETAADALAVTRSWWQRRVRTRTGFHVSTTYETSWIELPFISSTPATYGSARLSPTVVLQTSRFLASTNYFESMFAGFSSTRARDFGNQARNYYTETFVSRQNSPLCK